MIRVALIAAFLCSSSAFAGDLRWTFKERASWQVAIEQEIASSVATSAAARDKKQPLAFSKFAWHSTWTVREAGQDAATIAIVFDRLAVEFRTGKSPAIRFDSADAGEPNPAAKEIAAALKSLVKAEIAVKLTRRGEVRETIVPPATEAALRRAGASGRLREMLSAEGFQRLIAAAFPALPEKAVMVGEKWTRTSETAAALGKTQTTYTTRFDSVMEVDKQRLAKLLLSAEFAFAGGKTNLETKATLNDEELTLTTRIVDQASSGTALFDLTAGRYAASELSQTIAFETTGAKPLGWQEFVTKTKMTLR